MSSLTEIAVCTINNIITYVLFHTLKPHANFFLLDLLASHTYTYLLLENN